MLWLSYLAQAPSSVTPLDNATDSRMGEICFYGLLGILTLALCWLFYRGWRLPDTAAQSDQLPSVRGFA